MPIDAFVMVSPRKIQFLFFFFAVVDIMSRAVLEISS